MPSPGTSQQAASPARYKTIDDILARNPSYDISNASSGFMGEEMIVGVDEGSIEIMNRYHYHESIDKLISVDTTDNNNINVIINYSKDDEYNNYINNNTVSTGNNDENPSVLSSSINENALPTPRIANTTSECTSSLLVTESSKNSSKSSKKSKKKESKSDKKTNNSDNKKRGFFRKKKNKNDTLPSIAENQQILSQLNHEDISQEQLMEIKKTLAALSTQVEKLEEKKDIKVTSAEAASAMRTDNKMKRRFLLSFLRKKKNVIISNNDVKLDSNIMRLPLPSIQEESASNASGSTLSSKVTSATSNSFKDSSTIVLSQLPTITSSEQKKHIEASIKLFSPSVEDTTTVASQTMLANYDSGSFLSLLASDRYRITEMSSATPDKYTDASILDLDDLPDPTRFNNKSKPPPSNDNDINNNDITMQKVDSIDESVVQSWVYEVVCAASDELDSKNSFSTLKAKHTAQRMIFNSLKENIGCDKNDKTATTRYQEIAGSTASLIVTGLTSKISREQVTILAVSVLTSKDCYQPSFSTNKNVKINNNTVRSLASIFTDTERSESYMNTTDSYTYDSSKLHYRHNNDQSMVSTFDDNASNDNPTSTSWINIFHICFGTESSSSHTDNSINFDSFTDTMLTSSITDLNDLSLSYQEQSSSILSPPSVGTDEVEEEYIEKVKRSSKRGSDRKEKSKKISYSSSGKRHVKVKKEKKKAHKDVEDDYDYKYDDNLDCRDDVPIQKEAEEPNTRNRDEHYRTPSRKRNKKKSRDKDINNDEIQNRKKCVSNKSKVKEHPKKSSPKLKEEREQAEIDTNTTPIKDTKKTKKWSLKLRSSKKT